MDYRFALDWAYLAEALAVTEVQPDRVTTEPNTAVVVAAMAPVPPVAAASPEATALLGFRFMTLC